MDLLCNPILHSRAERIDKLRQSGIAMSRRSNPNPEWTCRLELDNAQPDYVVDLLLHRRHLGDTSDLFAHTPHAHTHTHTHTHARIHTQIRTCVALSEFKSPGEMNHTQNPVIPCPSPSVSFIPRPRIPRIRPTGDKIPGPYVLTLPALFLLT